MFSTLRLLTQVTENSRLQPFELCLLIQTRGSLDLVIPGVPPALISIHGDLVELAMLRVAVIFQGSGPSRDLLSLLYLRRGLKGA